MADTNEYQQNFEDEDYRQRLNEFLALKGGLPKGLGMAAAQSWYIRREEELRQLHGCVRRDQ